MRRKRIGWKMGEEDRGQYKGEWNLCGKGERDMERMTKGRKIVEGGL
jgi:hypothetical protein